MVFDKPVVNYLDNFLGTPVGADIPVGDYNWDVGRWEGDPDARVIEILDEVAGKAIVDVTGFGAANADELDYYGIDDDELEMLADTYEPGKTLWRTEMPRFSEKDINKGEWIRDQIEKNRAAAQGGPDEDCWKPGSIIGCQNQTLGEEVALSGTPYHLRYASARTPGAVDGRSIRVPLTDDVAPGEDVEAIEVTVLIAGQRMREIEEDPQANQTVTFRWDGNDKFGRPMVGGAVADINVEDVVDGNYGSISAGGVRRGPDGTDNAQWIWVVSPYFSRNRTIAWGIRATGPSLASVRSHLDPDSQPVDRPNLECSDDLPGVPVQEQPVPECWYEVPPDSRKMPDLRSTLRFGTNSRIPVPYHDARSSGVGGWGISAHHRYDTATGTLFTGDGERRSAESLADIVETVRTPRDLGFPTAANGVAALPDGSVVWVSAQARQVFREWPDGQQTLFAGDGGATAGTGDGGPAVDAGLGFVDSIAAGPDGSVYLVEGNANVVRQVSSDGTITRFAGDGTQHWTKTSSNPVATGLAGPRDVAVAPDGTVYITATRGLYRIDPSRLMTLYAGDVSLGCGRQDDSCLIETGAGDRVAVGPQGTLYWTIDGPADLVSLYRLRPGEAEPKLLVHAADPSNGAIVEGPLLGSNLAPLDIEVDANERLWVTDSRTLSSVWRLEADGRVHQMGLAGCTTTDPNSDVFAGEGGPFRAACGNSRFVSRGPDGLYFQDGTANDVSIRRVRGAIARYPNSESLVPSEDGSEAYRFDRAGRHLSTIDGRTERTIRTFGYDSEGRLTSINETDFGSTTIAYSSSGDAMVTGPDGQVTEIEINPDGYATSVTDAEGGAHEFEYTSGGLMTEHSDQLGKSSEFTWDPAGRLLSDTSRRGNTQTLSRTQGPVDSAVTHELPTGEETTYTREDDGRGRPKHTVVGPDGATAVSRRAGDTDPTVTQTQADGTQATQRAVADPRWASAVARGEGTARTPDGKTTTVARSSKVQRASNADRNDPFDYTSLIETLAIDGRTTTGAYVKDQRKLTVTSPMGRTAAVQFDEEDRPTTISSAGRADTAIEYDSRGRPESVTQAGETSTVAYGADGYVEEVTDEEGGSTTFVRDDVGRATAITGADSETTEVDYDAAGQIEKIAAPDGREFTFEYDEDGNVAAASRGARPGSGAAVLDSELAYDEGGRIESITTASGNEIEVGYDSAGRSSVTETADGTATTTTYQSFGGRRLKSVATDEGVETSFDYDGPLGTEIATSGDVGVGSGTAVEYDYDSSLRPIEETIDGDSLAATINGDDQLTAVGDVGIDYDPATGDPESISAGKSEQTVSLDTRGLTAATSATAGSVGSTTQVFEEEITRDGLGRIIERQETAGGAPITYSYTYDDAGQLTAIATPLGQTEGFGYDSTGGLVTKGVGILAASIPTDGHGRPTADASGNPINWSTDGEATSLPRPSGGQSTLTFDGFGRLKTVTGGGDTAEYTYDGLGRRVALKTDGQLTRRYVYGAGLFPRARLDASGDILERYVYASREHVPDLIIRRDGTRLRLISDTLGSVRVVIDADTGAVVQRLAYTAYGQVTQDTNPGAQPFGYKGSLTDPAAEGAGLVWKGVRAYVPSIGRFLTPEPLGIAAAWDEHAALAGDPVNFVDPDGRVAMFVPFLVAGAVGAFANGGADLVGQVAGNAIAGCPLTDINWTSVGINAGIGAVTGGYGALAGRAGKLMPAIKPGSSGGPSAGKPFPKRVRDEALNENPSTCVLCRMETDRPQVDHAIPRARGGNATLDNAQTTCPHCNASKGARDYPVNPPPGYRGKWPPSWWR